MGGGALVTGSPLVPDGGSWLPWPSLQSGVPFPLLSVSATLQPQAPGCDLFLSFGHASSQSVRPSPSLSPRAHRKLQSNGRCRIVELENASTRAPKNEPLCCPVVGRRRSI